MVFPSIGVVLAPPPGPPPDAPRVLVPLSVLSPPSPSSVPAAALARVATTELEERSRSGAISHNFRNLLKVSVAVSEQDIGIRSLHCTDKNFKSKAFYAELR